MSEELVEIEVTQEESEIVEWIMSNPLHLQLVRLMMENDTLKKRVKELEDLIQDQTYERNI